MSDKWMTIDSAPKDGTRVLVWSPGLEQVFLAEWTEIFDDAGQWMPEYAEVPMLDEPEDHPTHWMPLPPAPKDASHD